MLDFSGGFAKSIVRQAFTLCPAMKLKVLKHSDGHSVLLGNIERKDKDARAISDMGSLHERVYDTLEGLSINYMEPKGNGFMVSGEQCDFVRII